MSARDGDICRRCGACCVSYRVSFHWLEAAESGIPDELVERVTASLACMAGTNAPAPRCVALAGTVGAGVACTLYARRPSPCREVQVGDDRCNRARARHGLPPVEPCAGADAGAA